MAVESQVNVVRDACLRHFGQGGVDVGDGLTAAQFQAACSDLAKEKDFENFSELAGDKGLAAAVYSRCAVCLFVCLLVSSAHGEAMNKLLG